MPCRATARLSAADRPSQRGQVPQPRIFDMGHVEPRIRRTTRTCQTMEGRGCPLGVALALAIVATLAARPAFAAAAFVQNVGTNSNETSGGTTLITTSTATTTVGNTIIVTFAMDPSATT